MKAWRIAIAIPLSLIPLWLIAFAKHSENRTLFAFCGMLVELFCLSLAQDDGAARKEAADGVG